MAETIDINKAGAEELRRALQVSEEHVRRILDRREQLGGFRSWEELKQVAGIDDVTVESLKDGGFIVIETGTPPRVKGG
ncbi:helix-hairpin-helix domain-containing protein [Sorangium sp. So ce315]|uniref:ComEA family DNA-binding protein n=1 Tax=Sorangium sp. So ce315 TaxID=3133299 RepID=UPI003F61F7AB